MSAVIDVSRFKEECMHSIIIIGSPGSSDLLQYVSVKMHVVQDYLIGALVGMRQIAALLLNLYNTYTYNTTNTLLVKTLLYQHLQQWQS